MNMSDILSIAQIVSSCLVIPLFSVIWGMNNRLVRLEERVNFLISEEQKSFSELQSLERHRR